MDFLYPSFLAWNTYQRWKGEELAVVLDYSEAEVYGKPSATYEALSTLGKPTSFQQEIRLLRSASVKYLCFERLIVGLQRNGIYGSDDLPLGGYQKMRDFMVNRYKLPPNPTKTECKAIYIKRVVKRTLLNEEEVLEIMNSVLGPECSITSVIFEKDITFEDQMKTIAAATWLISLAGSGSHHMVWLPDTAVSLVIVHPLHYDADVNKKICNTTETVLCLKSSSTVPEGTVIPEDVDMAKELDVVANLTDFEAALREGIQWRAEQERAKALEKLNKILN